MEVNIFTIAPGVDGPLYNIKALENIDQVKKENIRMICHIKTSVIVACMIFTAATMASEEHIAIEMQAYGAIPTTALTRENRNHIKYGDLQALQLEQRDDDFIEQALNYSQKIEGKYKTKIQEQCCYNGKVAETFATTGKITGKVGLGTGALWSLGFFSNTFGMIEPASPTTAMVLFLGLGSTFLISLAASGITLPTAYFMDKKRTRATTILHNQTFIQQQIQRIQGNSTSQSTDSSDCEAAPFDS